MNLEQKTIDILNRDYFPLFKSEFEEGFRFRDVDSELWINSEEDELLRTRNKAVLYIKEKYGDEWKVAYDDLSSNIHKAAIEIDKIKKHYKIWKNNWAKAVMFEVHNQMFRLEYVFMDQLCVVGIPIEPEKYDTIDGSLKISFFDNIIFSYELNTVVLHAGQLYMNGKLLYHWRDLSEALHRTGYRFEDFDTELLNFVQENIPEADYYSSWSMSGYFRRKSVAHMGKDE